MCVTQLTHIFSYVRFFLQRNLIKYFVAGPYSGRSPDIIQKLGGVMLNPNCEYGANFVAIHTLAQWSKCTVDGTMPNSNDSISGKKKLEWFLKMTTSHANLHIANQNRANRVVSPLIKIITS